jgi:DNA-binding NarL/FixJ family response regulator
LRPAHRSSPLRSRGAADAHPCTGCSTAAAHPAREREILELVEAGWSNKEIARRLEIKGATVKNHIHSILQKLQVSRRGQAAAMLRVQRAQA